MPKPLPPSNHPAHTEQLGQINQKILAAGETLPTVQLRDGSTVQTGTVAALLHNVALYNAGARGQVEHEMALAVPTLFKVGLFDLFAPAEWMQGGSPGRRRVGELAQAWLDQQRDA